MTLLLQLRRLLCTYEEAIIHLYTHMKGIMSLHIVWPINNTCCVYISRIVTGCVSL